MNKLNKRTTLVQRDWKTKMARKTEKVQLSESQGPKGTWRWALETSQTISEESKRTGKMPECYRLTDWQTVSWLKSGGKQILLTQLRAYNQPLQEAKRHSQLGRFQHMEERKHWRKARNSLGNAENRYQQFTAEEYKWPINIKDPHHHENTH